MKTDMQPIQEYFEQEVEELEVSLIEDCRKCDDQTAQLRLQKLIQMTRLKNVSDAMQEETKPANTTLPTYQMSSLFLSRVFEELNNGPDEDARFCTGIQMLDNVYVVDALLKFRCALRSPVAVKGEQSSVNQTLIKLYRFDHKLLMTAHIHPGSGAAACGPSSIDMDMHRRLEGANYPAIGLIFSRSGHFRYFSNARKFKINIYGKGVSHERDNIYRLTENS